MTFTVKTAKSRRYLYYQAGKESLYIGPQSKPDKAKQENVLRALEHAWGRAGHYLDAADDLLSMLPTPLRKKHMTRRMKLLQGKATRLDRGRLP